ncbi:MAG: DoxX family protein [Acidobacteriota bacterium]|jgi:putative oxidoreductase|nr:DoxX family protein [Blastocatellia bacterium]MDQ3219714.1 DoxX family protein [Acidobacteriota bacterium]MDQ3490089.1 DoxX family protein [Acidobacteriota bacterium]
MLRQILFGGETGLSPLANAGITLLRIFAGVSLALAHGAGKLPPTEGFIEGTAKMGFPVPGFFAWAAALTESVGGIFLALGFLTRLSSSFIIVLMCVAILRVHALDPYPKKELAFLYLFIAIAFMLKGSGDWSIDSFLRK